ncbi:MAG: hypothetical protein HQ572_06185 [Candidatus Omnitrophica bacterium]|nr:hypothetical protein [Candidatus Omnitrophota bacterium]
MVEEAQGQQQQVQQEDPVVKDGKIFAIVAYIGILCLLPLLLKKENKFALHHGKQGLVLLIAEVVGGVVGIIPFIGWVLVPFLMLAFLIFSIIGIIQAASGITGEHL